MFKEYRLLWAKTKAALTSQTGGVVALGVVALSLFNIVGSFVGLIGTIPAGQMATYLGSVLLGYFTHWFVVVLILFLTLVIGYVPVAGVLWFKHRKHRK